MTSSSQTSQPPTSQPRTNLALIVARRQKRLTYWAERLANSTNAHSSGSALSHSAESIGANSAESIPAAREIEERLKTYRLLLSKLVRATDAKEQQETESRLAALDRQLTSLFEARRLMTCSIGVASVGDK